MQFVNKKPLEYQYLINLITWSQKKIAHLSKYCHNWWIIDVSNKQKINLLSTQQIDVEVMLSFQLSQFHRYLGKCRPLCHSATTWTTLGLSFRVELPDLVTSANFGSSRVGPDADCYHDRVPGAASAPLFTRNFTQKTGYNPNQTEEVTRRPIGSGWVRVRAKLCMNWTDSNRTD